MAPVGELPGEAVFDHHAHPACAIALDQQLFVVRLGIDIALAIAQHGVHRPQELVGGGDRGALVAALGGERFVIAMWGGYGLVDG